MCQASILVADDHEVVRSGLRSLIQEQPEWKLVAEAKDGRDAVAKINELKPDVAIIDVGMPSLNGLDATRQILKVNKHTKILILSMYDSEELIESILNTGARGYVRKADASSDLVRAVQALLNGQTFFTHKAAQIMLERFTGKRERGAESNPRELGILEKEILRLLAQGKIVKEVAAELGLNTSAVEKHRKSLMRKLDCHCASDLVRYAVRNHLVEA